MRSYAPFTPIVTGLVLIAIGRLAQRLTPVLGRVAYQAAAAGSYSTADYRLPLGGFYLVALALIVLGIVLVILDRRTSRRS